MADLTEGSLHDWDYYKYYKKDQAEIENKQCKVCNRNMLVQRNIEVPFVKMSQRGGMIDLFVCPEAHKDYHKQALCLKLNISMEASTKVIEIYESELNSILETQTATIKTNWYPMIQKLYRNSVW